MHRILSTYPIAVVILVICIIIFAIYFIRFICSQVKKQVIKMDNKPKLNIEEAEKIEEVAEII